ncbi:MAG: hypothetical protein WDW38_011562 [Sanguina aurantia]
MSVNVAAQFEKLRAQLDKEVTNIEKTVGDMEYQYLQLESSQMGTVLKGFEGFLSSKDTMRKRSRNVFRTEDRLFSLSSKTSPVSREQEQANQEISESMAMPNNNFRGKVSG